VANAAQIPIAQRRDSLRLMLETRGLTREEAVAQVAAMSDAQVTEDLTFHLREDAASKRVPPATLPFAELFAHYTGPLHRLNTPAAEAAARGGATAPPGGTALPGSTPPAPEEVGLDPRYVVGAAVGGLAFAVLVFIAARAALRDRRPPELDAPAPASRPVTQASRGRRAR